MKSLGYASLGMTFANSLNMLINTGQYASSVSSGSADTTYLIFVVSLVVVLGVIYYFTTSKAGKL
jgi:hypothetical protein